jgi:hypothetical protein
VLDKDSLFKALTAPQFHAYVREWRINTVKHAPFLAGKNGIPACAAQETSALSTANRCVREANEQGAKKSAARRAKGHIARVQLGLCADSVVT